MSRKKRRPTRAAGRVRCVLCGSEFRADETTRFQALRYFEDRCFCHECLRQQREGGWREPAVRLR